MCTLFIHRSKNSDWPILIANNRDEYLSRTFKPPGYHWNNNIFAGKDRVAGGSWLGVNKHGLCAAILNRESNIENDKYLISRGELVIKALKYQTASIAKREILKHFRKKYLFFNLFIADINNAYWLKYDNFILKVSKIPIGCSILDKFDLNDDKSARQSSNRFFFEKSMLPKPEKENYHEWEKLLTFSKLSMDEKDTSIYVKKRNNNYGTVCSSIIAIPSKRNLDKSIVWLYRKTLSTKSRFRKLRVFS